MNHLAKKEKSTMPQHRANHCFLDACKRGQRLRARALQSGLRMKHQADIHVNIDAGFRLACASGNVDLVCDMLTSPEWAENFDIHSQREAGFRAACCVGDVEMVRFLSTSPRLRHHADVTLDEDVALQYACAHGSLEVVKFLLTSPDLKNRGMLADLHAAREGGLRAACRAGHLEIIRFLILATELDDHADLPAVACEIFKYACKNNEMKAVRLLIEETEWGLHFARGEVVIQGDWYAGSKPENRMFICDLAREMLRADLSASLPEAPAKITSLARL